MRLYFIHFIAYHRIFSHHQKEVSRLQNVINGGTEKHDDDAWTVSFPGSPGTFKWEGAQGSFSPVTGVKRMSQVLVIFLDDGVKNMGY